MAWRESPRVWSLSSIHRLEKARSSNHPSFSRSVMTVAMISSGNFSLRSLLLTSSRVRGRYRRKRREILWALLSISFTHSLPNLFPEEVNITFNNKGSSKGGVNEPLFKHGIKLPQKAIEKTTKVENGNVSSIEFKLFP